MKLSKNALGLKLSRAVFGFYFVIAITITLIQLLLEYFYVKETLFKELFHLSGTIHEGVAASLWDFNQHQMELISRGMFEIQSITGLAIADTDNQLLTQIGQVPLSSENIVSKVQKKVEFKNAKVNEIVYRENGTTKTLYEYKFEVYYQDQDTDRIDLVGYCYLYSDENQVLSRMYYRFFLIIINSAVKTLMLWLLFYFFTKRIITRPLNSLTQSVKSFDPNDHKSFDSDNALKRLIEKNSSNELTYLANVFIKMRAAIVDKITLIEDLNAKLEQRVKKRTATIEKINQELRHLILHDALTSLPNRVYFYEKLTELIDLQNKDNTFAVVSIDLKNFKPINDAYGHLAGDGVLKTLSQRMLTEIKQSDMVARMGGDEFALIITDVDETSALTYLKTFSENVIQPIEFNQTFVEVGANIGVSIYPKHGEDCETLFQHADIAMYYAKKNAQTISIFSMEVKKLLDFQEVMARTLPIAIEQNDFILYYQPILSCKTNDVVCLEALLRWQNPVLGFVPPDQFIPVAERMHLIEAITDWVIEVAAADGKRFLDQGYSFEMSVNISSSLLSDLNFPKRIFNLVQKSGFPANKILLVITESVVMKEPDQVIQVLMQLRSYGFRVSIDDFGAGYSSFSYLSKLPVDDLKIDRNFLFDFDQNTNSQLVVQSIIELAHRLQLTVVAEGIEQLAIFNQMKSLECDKVQGFYFSRPLPYEALLQWLQEQDSQGS